MIAYSEIGQELLAFPIKFSMNGFCKVFVSLRSKFRGFKTSEIMKLFIVHSSGYPKISRFINTFKPIRIIFWYFSIFAVLRVCSFTKIIPSIIVNNTIFMINKIFRKSPNHIKKSKPMCSIRFCKKLDSYIPILSVKRPSASPDNNARFIRSFYPLKFTCFRIVKQIFFELFLSEHFVSPANMVMT